MLTERAVCEGYERRQEEEGVGAVGEPGADVECRLGQLRIACRGR